VAPTAAWADALATIAFVLGPGEGLELLEAETGVEGLIVDSEGRRHLSSGLQGRVEWR
jgi:thiamine biosynthesis lipoprotein